MKATICKLEKETKYFLANSFIKVDQGSDLVIINPKCIRKLGLKIRPKNTLALHYLGISIANKDCTKLKS